MNPPTKETIAMKKIDLKTNMFFNVSCFGSSVANTQTFDSFVSQVSKDKMAPKLSTLKRPSAAMKVKDKPKSPKVPRKPEMADESPATEKPEVAAVPEAEQAAGSTRVEKPVVAHKGKDAAKPEKGSGGGTVLRQPQFLGKLEAKRLFLTHTSAR